MKQILVVKNILAMKNILVVKQIDPDGQDDAWTSWLEKLESRDLTRDVISLVSLPVIRTVALNVEWLKNDRIIEISRT